jgi:hypothetical protein
MSTRGDQAEFDFEAFETEVSEDDEDRVIEAIADSINRLRDQIDDDTLEDTLRSNPGSYVMRADFTEDQLDPEPTTQSRVIEPLLQSLGYRNYGYEAGDFSEERGKQADYSVSLRDVDGVESSRLLIEAEPINKPLRDRGHGLDQVKSWLSQREFESDFGFATDGVRWIFVRYDPDSYSHNVIGGVDLQPVFVSLFENATTAQRDPTVAVSDAEREVVAQLLRTFDYDNFLSIIDDAQAVIKRRQEEITDQFYEDYIEIVFGVDEGTDERRARSLVGDGIVAPDEADGDDTRQFAVELMNRLIFIKFLEDKRIVRSDLLNVLVETYEDGLYPQSLYETFFDPLFYDVLNEKPADRDPQVTDLDVFEGVPYLNGGLFGLELNDTSEINERDFDVRDSVLQSIVDLLERYRFSTDGGPTDIDPSVLGSVFEKTINYLTTDAGDQNAELGAYYTPKEITRFSAEETVQPALMDRFKQVLAEERGWPEPELDQYETLYELIDGLPGSGDLITTLLAEMDEFYVVDPSMGSGHFLTSVLEEIVNVRQALYAQQESQPSRHRLKKTSVQNNIYGVDIMQPAVQIGKLRLWLSIISELREEDLETLNVEEIALPNITFNIRSGNSLIGYVGFPDETDEGLATFERYNVQSRYEDVVEQIELYEEASAFPKQAEEHQERANELLSDYRQDLDDQILRDFRNVVDDVSEDDLEEYTPFHWVLEFAKVYADGGFDVIVGNPPWDRLRPTRDEFFVRYDEDFLSLLPEEKDTRQEELLEQAAIAEEWEAYQQEIEVVTDYFHDSDAYEMQTPTIGGTTQGTENDLSALFLERIFGLAKDGGYVSQVLPGAIFNGASTKDLRTHLLDETTIRSLVTFENRGIFDDIDTRYNFGVVNFQNSGKTEDLRGIFQQVGTDILNRFDEATLDIPRRVLREYSPEARIFPYLQSQEEVDVLNSLVAHPPISEKIGANWYIEPYRELDRGNDVDRFVEQESDGEYPVLGGSNIYQFMYDPTFLDDLEAPKFWSVSENDDPERSAKRRIREKNHRRFKRQLYQAFDGTGSQIGFVNDLLNDHRGEELSEDDILLDCTEYRIAYRDIARATDERTLIATVLPRGVVCHDKAPTFRPYEIDPDEEDLTESPIHGVYERIFTDQELFTALGLLNSIPFDYLMRTKVDSTVVFYKLTESQAPRLTAGDDWFEHIWRRAARLNCYGDAFAEMRERLGGVDPATEPGEREQVQAELDAGAFHAYGLDQEQVRFILDDFYQVNSPRRMTNEYLEFVLKKYDEVEPSV